MTRSSSLVCALAALSAAACAAKGSGTNASSGAGGASADTSGPEPAMKGTIYEAGRVFGQTYCSPCHWIGGKHAKQPVAYVAFQVDTYEQWATGGTIIPAVLDKWNPDGTVMPPPEAPSFPPDDQRMLILDWVRRGSPNTPSGT
jgi:hypothetical protein